MPPSRRRKRRSRVLPAFIAIALGLAVATGIYWRQNPDVEFKVPQNLAVRATAQDPAQTPVPDSFAAITATKAPQPTRQAPPDQAEEPGGSPSFTEKVSQTVSETWEERRARLKAENEAEEKAMVEAIERKVHDGINAERTSYGGTSPLQWDDRLGAIARAHSKDMTERRYFSHDTPEGVGPSERAAKAGYSCRKFSHVGLAENITIELMSNDLDEVAAAAVQGWMDSPGHRFNLLDRQYDRTGVGASFGAWRGHKAVYLTQVFC